MTDYYLIQDAIEWWNYDVTLLAKTRTRVSILALPVPSPQGQWVFWMGFWLNPLYKVRGSHKLKILSHFILQHKHTSYNTLVIFKLLCFLKKRLLNGITGAIGDIKRHRAEQFINLQYFSIVV